MCKLEAEFSHLALAESYGGGEVANGPARGFRVSRKLKQELDSCRGHPLRLGWFWRLAFADHGPVVFIAQSQMYVADLVCERNASVNQALRGRRGQVWSQQECCAILDAPAAIPCGLPFTLDLTDDSIQCAAVEKGSLRDERKAVLAPRCCDFDNAAIVPITRLLELTGDAARMAQPECGRTGVHRIADQLASVHKYIMSIFNGHLQLSGQTALAPILETGCFPTAGH